MIYDCFTYSGLGTEDRLLRLRIAELAPLNPVHVIVEAEHTFTMLEKGIKFKPSAFPDANIIHFPIDFARDSPWENERMQRNMINTALPNNRLSGSDIIILSDLDEIPRRSAVEKYRTEFGLCALQMDEYHLFLNTQHGRQTWRHPRIMPWSYLKERNPDEVRNGGFDLALMNAGWHFSWTGSYSDILDKFKSFSHQEKEVQKHAKGTHIQVCRDNLRHLITGEKLREVQPEGLPEYVRTHRPEFESMLYKFESVI